MHHLIIMIFFLSLLSGCVGKPPQKESFIPHSSVSDAHNKKYPSDKDVEIKHQKIIDQIREDIIGKEAWFNSKVCSDIEIKKSDLPINKKFNLSNDYLKIRFLDMRTLFEISEESSLIPLVRKMIVFLKITHGVILTILINVKVYAPK